MTVLLEDGEDVLEEVELLVRRRRPEIVAVDDQRLLRRLAGLVDDGDAALLPEGGIGQDDLVFAVLAGEGVLGDDRELEVDPGSWTAGMVKFKPSKIQSCPRNVVRLVPSSKPRSGSKP